MPTTTLRVIAFKPGDIVRVNAASVRWKKFRVLEVDNVRRLARLTPGIGAAPYVLVDYRDLLPDWMEVSSDN